MTETHTSLVNSLGDWSVRPVREDLGRSLFSFVVIADTHVDLEDGPSSSPFPVNALTNKRTRFCVSDIAQMAEKMGASAPKFAIHLGDLIHPVPSMPTYAEAAREFLDIMSGLPMPYYLLPGNHDVGDKPVDWAPAGVVRDEFLAMWDKHFGPDYQSFVHENCAFILLNAQIINSDLAREDVQRTWFEAELEKHSEKRCFVSIHYPPFIYRSDEHEHYDNIAEPGRGWLLELLARYKVEALFCGHVHHYWYNNYKDVDCYLLPSTSFTRQDFSEMFRAAPLSEMQDGRNDIYKTGYYTVQVYEHGHVCHFHRTDGALQERGSGTAALPSRIAPIHARETSGPALAIDIRHPWAEVTDIAPSGALDEFRRKQVRNDYPLLALWDMGIRDVRLPAEDFGRSDILERIKLLANMGHRVAIISQGIPDHETLMSIRENTSIIERYDIAAPLKNIQDIANRISADLSGTGVEVHLSKLRMKSDVVKDGEPYFHLISHGFTPGDRDELANLFSIPDISRAFQGVVFRCGRGENVLKQAQIASEIGIELNVKASLNVFMADANPALHQRDDLANANRVAEAIMASHAYPSCTVTVDTFMDHDRGHSVRNGFVDRYCNPRSAYGVAKHLQPILSRGRDVFINQPIQTDRGCVYEVCIGSMQFIIILPSSKDAISHVNDSIAFIKAACAGIDLITGQIFGDGSSAISPEKILIDSESLLRRPVALLVD